jgi:protein-tyrosine phosphatase
MIINIHKFYYHYYQNNNSPVQSLQIMESTPGESADADPQISHGETLEETHEETREETRKETHNPTNEESQNPRKRSRSDPPQPQVAVAHQEFMEDDDVPVPLGENEISALDTVMRIRIQRYHSTILRYNTEWRTTRDTGGMIAVETESPVQILPMLFLGSACHLILTHEIVAQMIARLGIRAVFNVAVNDTVNIKEYSGTDAEVYGPDIQVEKYVCYEGRAYVRENFNMLPIIERGVAFYKECVASGKPLLVHCVSGVNRSATVVLGILMAIKKMPLETALEELRKHRPFAAPGYTRDLMMYDLKARFF